MINRGNNRQDVFHKLADFQAFLTALADLKLRKPFELYGYCLLNNHFHLLLRPKGPTISRIVQACWFRARSDTTSITARAATSGRDGSSARSSRTMSTCSPCCATSRPTRYAPRWWRADEYPWSSYRVHGLGEANELVDRLFTYEELSPLVKVRARKWAEKVHRPMEEAVLDAIRRSNATALPHGDETWTRRLAKRLDLTIRPRGRPRKTVNEPNK